MKKPLPRIMTVGISAGVLGLAILVARASYEAPAEPSAVDPETEGRTGRRAFYTAPPTIPHEVTDRGNKECLHCHRDIRKVGDRVTVLSPHVEMQNCQQCHVGEQSLNTGLMVETVGTDWLGLEEPGAGTRANDFAPPTVPHRLFMREDCLSCHHPDQPDEAMRTAHPERSQCLQCHALDEARRF